MLAREVVLAAAHPKVFVREPGVKRALDVVLSGTGLLLTLPLWIVIAAVIWLEDGRPIFFRQERIGRGGRMFLVMKFRSMWNNPAAVEVQAGRNDPRITRVGRLLRRTALDELPQIWNIFKGDMSFVGPRSQPERELVRVGDTRQPVYIREVPGYAMRQQLRPGLTGIAQVYGPRDVSHRLKFRYDNVYVRRVAASADRYRRRQAPLATLRGDVDVLRLDVALIARSIWNTLRGAWEV